MQEPLLIDSHAHLDFEPFATDLDQVLERAIAAGVAQTVILGTDAQSSLRVDQLTRRYTCLFGGAGVHPHEAGKFEQGDWEVLERLWQQPRIVALGETGLDYYYDFSPPETQQALFRRQLMASDRLKLPVVIHIRDAFEDAFQIISQCGLGGGGVLHCFTGGPRECERALELGLSISLAGIVTFPKASQLQQVARQIPADRLLVETDAPYLAPVPQRGQRNEPSFVQYTARKIAELRQVDYDRLCAQTRANTIRLFKLPLVLEP